MSKALAVIYYTATMAVFNRWLAAGIIREDELIKLRQLSLKNTGFPSAAYIAKTLDNMGFWSEYVIAKGGHYGKDS